MSQQRANYACPQCDGRLKPTDHAEYECSECGCVIRESVCERLESFKRVAEGDGPLSEIAKAALEGRQ